MLDFLSILQPEHVPARSIVMSSLASNVGGRCAALRLGDDPWACNRTAAREVDRLSAHIAPSETRDGYSQSTADEDIHDAYFHVKRVDGDRSMIFFWSIVWTNALFLRDLDDAPFGTSACKLEALDAAFKALQAWLLGLPATVGSRVKTWASTGTEAQSRMRWIRGHQVFAALTQGLIAAFGELRATLVCDDTAGIDDAAELAVALLRGSAAALEFTGDMSSEEYLNVIRPSMTPPLVPDTFSGLLSTDHRRFIALLREMKPALEALSERRPELHARIAQAVAGVYDSHKFVCQLLVGKSPSLMMSSAAAASGADQIEKFKSLRLKVFEARRPVAQDEKSRNVLA